MARTRAAAFLAVILTLLATVAALAVCVTLGYTLAQEKATQEKATQEKATQEKATQEKATQEKATQEKATQEWP